MGDGNDSGVGAGLKNSNQQGRFPVYRAFASADVRVRRTLTPRMTSAGDTLSRMFRRPLSIVSILSLIFFLAVCTLWMRSYRIVDVIIDQEISSCTDFVSMSGTLIMIHSDEVVGDNSRGCALIDDERLERRHLVSDLFPTSGIERDSFFQKDALARSSPFRTGPSQYSLR